MPAHPSASTAGRSDRRAQCAPLPAGSSPRTAARQTVLISRRAARTVAFTAWPLNTEGVKATRLAAVRLQRAEAATDMVQVEAIALYCS